MMRAGKDYATRIMKPAVRRPSIVVKANETNASTKPLIKRKPKRRV